MNISPLLPQVNSVQNLSSTQKHATQHYYNENVEINVNLSDQKTIINLSLSSSVTYQETIYNEKGLIAGTSRSNSGNNSILPREITETDDAPSKIDSIIDKIQENYLELLRKRVEYLLKQITEKKSGISNLSGISRSNTITDLLDFSPDKTAERIVDFALSFYDGGDRQQFAAMVKKAVMKGFNEAMKAFGGFLPRECHDTINIVNRALDDFARGTDV